MTGREDVATRTSWSQWSVSSLRSWKASVRTGDERPSPPATTRAIAIASPVSDLPPEGFLLALSTRQVAQVGPDLQFQSAEILLGLRLRPRRSRACRTFVSRPRSIAGTVLMEPNCQGESFGACRRA